MKIAKTISLIGILTAAVLVTTTSNAQVYGARSNDPWGWSQQTNRKGIQEACRSSVRRYNTLVNMYNGTYRHSKNRQVREAWKADIADARRDMERWCNQ